MKSASQNSEFLRLRRWAVQSSAFWKFMFVGAVVAGVGFDVSAQQAMIRLHGSISPAVARAVPVNRLNSGERIRFSIALPVRNQAHLDQLLKHLYAPGDPLYRKFLTADEFAQRFGPVQSNYDAVIRFVESQGMQVVGTYSNRLLLDVEGTASHIEAAFGVHMMHYRANNGRVFHAPDREPAVPSELSGKIAAIVGLDNALEPHSNLRLPRAQASGGVSGTGSGPWQGLTPSDIKTAYDLNSVAETGAGQTIALFELDGYLTSDIQAYEAYFGLPNVTVQNVLLDGVSGNPSALTNSGPLEVTLDIELAMALAPNVNRILVYEGNNFVDVYNRIASDNAAQQVSSSWYAGQENDVPSGTRNSENAAFQQMAAQGQTFYAASGDYGDKVRTGTDANGKPILKFGVQDPSSQQYVTGVGGTTLATAGAGGAYSSETTWAGSGGGVSTIWSLPNYQSSTVSPGSGGSSSFRNVPDVSLDSDPGTGYSVYYNGGWTIIGGTSCAAPLWASFTALANQRAAAEGKPRIGFINPAIYSIANGSTYHSDFHDITTGNNGTYPAVLNYDNCTGWGSLMGANLIGPLVGYAGPVFVDFNYTGSTQDGSYAHPYKTMAGGVAAVGSGGTIIIETAGSSSETMTISKRMTVTADHPATVGH